MVCLLVEADQVERLVRFLAADLRPLDHHGRQHDVLERSELRDERELLEYVAQVLEADEGAVFLAHPGARKTAPSSASRTWATYSRSSRSSRSSLRSRTSCCLP